MIIRYIKDHPAGIKKGVVQDATEKFGKRMIDSEFAVKSTKKELEVFKKSIKDAETERLKVLEEIHYLAKEAVVAPIEKDCGCSGKTEDCEECTEAEKLAAAKLLEENK